MKVALVHDYLIAYGGAERVLEALHEMFPEAPVYVALTDKKKLGKFWPKFKDWQIKTSWFNLIPGAARLASPLRFLAPLIWLSFDFSKYDLVITSASWFITKGVRKGKKTIEICYCHAPPRFLYGYVTSGPWQRHSLIRTYASIVGHFLRLYDFWAAQRVDWFIANSSEVAARIKKFYRREAAIIHPPVEIGKTQDVRRKMESVSRIASHVSPYFLTGGRLVGYKNFDLIIKACNKLRLPLKIYGQGPMEESLRRLAGKKVEFVGRVSDKDLHQLLADCQAFIAAATDEEFGITLLEAMAVGKPVIAFHGGGYLDILVEGKTGEFFDEPMVESLVAVLKKFKPEKYKPEDCRRQAQKFSKERFKREIREFVEAKYARIA